jgi:hypothetical protein
MPDSTAEPSDKQTEQRELVERGQSLPGVAELLEVYGRLAAYTNVLVNVQPSQTRNAAGGNAA